MQPQLLITGGAGFLGSHLCERLLDDGWQVLCVDNLLTGSRENVRHLEDRPGFRFVHADVAASPVGTLEGALAGSLAGSLGGASPLAAVLHFASPASPVDYLQLPLETLAVGSVGTRNALDIAERHQARFLLASTSETYGDPLVHPQPESYWGNVNPIGPRSVYDEAKRFAEATTMAYRRYRDVDTAIVRIFNTYGPRMRPFDGRAVPTFILQALRGEPITVAGNGQQTRSVCYVDDLVEGIVRLLDSEHEGPMNIGNDEEITMLDLARTVRELCDSTSPITFVQRPEDDPCVRRPDTTKARELLGWAPKVGLAEGLSRTIDWFRSQPGLVR